MSVLDRSRRLLRQPVLRALLVFGLGVTLGRWVAPSDMVGPERTEPAGEVGGSLELASCPKRLKALQRDRRQLQEELAYLKQSVVVEQEACFGLRETLFEKEAQLSKLTEQLAFYRGIVAPEDRESGVRIFRLQLDPVAGRDYQYRVTLLQSVRQPRDAKGTLELALVGLDAAGNAVREAMVELSRDEEYSGEFAFRYYTELYGQFRVPEHWTPLRIEASVTPAGRSRPSATETFVWKDLIAAQGARESGHD